jgi:dimethylhistidine N-methyltransferase
MQVTAERTEEAATLVWRPMLKGIAETGPCGSAADTISPLADNAFSCDLKTALTSSSHAISPKYFYDSEGSRLFDRICELPEYYPTRTELAILQRCAGDIAALAGPGAEIVEFGAGSLRKARLLLEAFDQPARYLPIDISGEHLRKAAARLRFEFDGLDVQPIVADYTQHFVLPAQRGKRRIGFFPGSTLGNFTPVEALDFLRQAADLLRGGALVLGVDLVKDPHVLHAAYNDAQGVTAAFNLNLLARANRELEANFDLANFAHYAFYNAPVQRIEMHLVSRVHQSVEVDGDGFTLREGESLYTENSHKFTIAGLRTLAARAGFRQGPVWTDSDRLFSVHWLHAPGDGE